MPNKKTISFKSGDVISFIDSGYDTMPYKVRAVSGRYMICTRKHNRWKDKV